MTLPHRCQPLCRRPTPQGLPLEIYAFASETDWVRYEAIQDDIFDHILAVVGEFDLRLFQPPTGRQVMAAMAAPPGASRE